MISLLRTPITLVWAVLVLATGLSWFLGIEEGLAPDRQQAASVAILLIAFVKVRFIGLYFMELREAPVAMRGVIELYCAGVAALTIGLYLAA